MKKDEYIDFYGGSVQVPLSLIQRFGFKFEETKKEIASKYQTDYNVIKKITDCYFPLVLSPKQAIKEYGGDRIEIRSDDNYYQWFLIVCLSKFFRRPGLRKINHKKLERIIEENPILFSWEMFYFDVFASTPSESQVLKKIGFVRFSDQQLIEQYQNLKVIRHETTRPYQQSKHSRTHLALVTGEFNNRSGITRHPG